jgi:hypothetical protein
MKYRKALCCLKIFDIDFHTTARETFSFLQTGRRFEPEALQFFRARGEFQLMTPTPVATN